MEKNETREIFLSDFYFPDFASDRCADQSVFFENVETRSDREENAWKSLIGSAHLTDDWLITAHVGEAGCACFAVPGNCVAVKRLGRAPEKWNGSSLQIEWGVSLKRRLIKTSDFRSSSLSWIVWIICGFQSDNCCATTGEESAQRLRRLNHLNCDAIYALLSFHSFTFRQKNVQKSRFKRNKFSILINSLKLFKISHFPA